MVFKRTGPEETIRIGQAPDLRVDVDVPLPGRAPVKADAMALVIGIEGSGNITVADLHAYVKDRVSWHARNIGRSQNPVLHGDGRAGVLT